MKKLTGAPELVKSLSGMYLLIRLFRRLSGARVQRLKRVISKQTAWTRGEGLRGASGRTAPWRSPSVAEVFKRSLDTLPAQIDPEQKAKRDGRQETLTVA